MTEHKNINDAKRAVMAVVPYIEKSEKGSLPYHFAGEQAFLEKCRPALLEHGIDSAPVSMELLRDMEYTTKSGGRMMDVIIRCVFRYTHGDSGTFQDVAVLGEASDSSDKAVPKAITIASKYALRNFLMIEVGLDPDFAIKERAEGSPAWQRAVKRVSSCRNEQDVKSCMAELVNNKNAPFDETERERLRNMCADMATRLKTKGGRR